MRLAGASVVGCSGVTTRLPKRPVQAASTSGSAATIDAVSATLQAALNEPDGRPTCILAYTVSGKGVSFMEHGWQWHLGFLGPKDLQQAYKEVLEGSLG